VEWKGLWRVDEIVSARGLARRAEKSRLIRYHSDYPEGKTSCKVVEEGKVRRVAGIEAFKTRVDGGGTRNG
jgi:hypothetical protein